MKKIKYNSKFIKSNFILSVIWLLFGISMLIFGGNFGIIMSYLGMGIAYFILFLIYYKQTFLIITDDYIKRGRKKMLLSDVRHVKYFAEEYTVQSAKDKLIIGINNIDKSEYDYLHKYMIELRKSVENYN